VSTPPFLDLPDGVRATRLRTPRGELAGLVAGPKDVRPASAAPVLLVPGFTGSKEDFIAVLAPIAAAGHRVVAIDQRGQFESPGEDTDPSAYDVKSLAEDVLALVATRGAPVHLLGHSFGGLVARAAALADPHSVRSLVLLDSGPAAVPHPAANNLGLMVQALPVMDLASIWVAKRQIETEQGVVPAPAHIEEFLRRRFLANSPVALLRQAEQLLSSSDQVDELAALRLPMLVSYGVDDDTWPPPLQAEMAARLGAVVAEIPAAGHSPAAENPDATTAALVSFWASH
jgi:pimeloyl-ACP methyl ester carboxylesterase